jgi:hypothetical protein
MRWFDLDRSLPAVAGASDLSYSTLDGEQPAPGVFGVGPFAYLPSFNLTL